MSNLNRILSFIIGLIVLVILLLFINSRINKSNTAQSTRVTPTPVEKQDEKKGFDFFGLFRKKTTPTPSISVTPSPGTGDAMAGGESEEDMNLYGGQQGSTTPGVGTPTPGLAQGGGGAAQATPGAQMGTGVNGVQEIPRTGAGTILLPLAIAGLAGGSYLRKAKKRS